MAGGAEFAATGTVVVTGPPGAGKSTVAALLAERLDRSILVAGDSFFDFLAAAQRLGTDSAFAGVRAEWAGLLRLAVGWDEGKDGVRPDPIPAWRWSWAKHPSITSYKV